MIMHEKPKTDYYSLAGTIIAAAILFPIGMWLKSHQVFGLGAWIVSWFQ